MLFMYDQYTCLLDRHEKSREWLSTYEYMDTFGPLLRQNSEEIHLNLSLNCKRIKIFLISVVSCENQEIYILFNAS